MSIANSYDDFWIQDEFQIGSVTGELSKLLKECGEVIHEIFASKIEVNEELKNETIDFMLIDPRFDLCTNRDARLGYMGKMIKERPKFKKYFVIGDDYYTATSLYTFAKSVSDEKKRRMRF